MRVQSRIGMLLVLGLWFSLSAAQVPRDKRRATEKKPANKTSTETQTEPQGDVETLKIDTNLVTVPVIASSRTAGYIADLRKDEFNVWEDGVPQQIAFFATISAPFHVCLLIDTSASTQEKLSQIQQAAIAFLDQLSSQDKVKVISFDEDVRDWNEFTSDKAALRSVIGQMRSGLNTRVYDATQMALDALRPIQQRKAIVIFTDGVDWHSTTSTFDSTIRDMDESGVNVYPIRFDTRAETERIARGQDAQTNGANLPTSDVIRRPPSGTTPTTFPSDEPSPVPNRQRSVLPIPPSIIYGRGNPYPPNGSPTDPFPNTDPRGTRRTDPTPNPGTIRERKKDDSITVLLDGLYMTADSYLKELADRSGGQVYRADTLNSLPQAFAAIAAELRTQYLLGYYPSKSERDGSYRKIQVKTSRKDIAIRARPGYRSRTAG